MLLLIERIMFLKLAWRNIWRNKRRTFITIASIFFAVLFAIFMNSIQKGAWVRMLDNIVNFYYGYAQIHQYGYWEDRSINKIFPFTKELADLGDETEGLTELVPRLESFALASFGTKTYGTMIIGVEPSMENEMTSLEDRLIEGRYFSSDESALLIAEGMAELLKVGVGDTIILLSQGYHGVNAVGKYPLVGIVRFASPELNKSMAYLPLNATQYFFGAEDMISSLALKIDDRDEVRTVIKALNKKLDPEEFEIMDWKEMLPELVEAQRTDAAGNYIFLVVLYAIIAFGIFGTILMMTKERSYEFGVLISIGMSRKLLGLAVWIEVIMLGLLGALAGMLGALPLVYYFKVHPLDFSEMSEEFAGAYEKWGFDPIMPTILDFPIFAWQAFVVFCITAILATYPIWKIRKLKPVEAMRE